MHVILSVTEPPRGLRNGQRAPWAERKTQERKAQCFGEIQMAFKRMPSDVVTITKK